MSAATATAVDRKSHARSRIGNGSALLPHVDGRSVWARLMRDTYTAILSHCGGADYISETKRMSARRIAALEAELVHLEDKFARARADGAQPDAADLDLYGRLANGQRRHMEAVGWERAQKDCTPSLARYLEQEPAA